MDIKRERPRRKAHLQAEDVQEGVQRGHVLFDTQHDAVVLDLQAVRVVRAESLIGLVGGVEVPNLLPGVRVHDGPDHPRRDDDPLFTQAELPDEAVEAYVDRVQRFHGVRVDRHAKRAVIVDIVGGRCPEVGKEGPLHIQRRLLVQIRIDLRQRAADPEDVLVLSDAAPLHLGLVELVPDDVGQAVPDVPLQEGVVPAAFRHPGDEDPLCDLRVIPSCGDELVRHRVADPDPAAVRDLVPLAVSPDLVPHLQRLASESCSLLDCLRHLHLEGVLPEHVLDELVQRVRLLGIRGAAVHAHVDLALVCPDHPGQLRADGLRQLRVEKVPVMVRIRDSRRQHVMPGLVEASIETLPGQDPDVIELVEGRNAAQLEDAPVFLGDPRRRSYALHNAF